MNAADVRRGRLGKEMAIVHDATERWMVVKLGRFTSINCDSCGKHMHFLRSLFPFLVRPFMNMTRMECVQCTYVCSRWRHRNLRSARHTSPIPARRFNVISIAVSFRMQCNDIVRGEYHRHKTPSRHQSATLHRFNAFDGLPSIKFKSFHFAVRLFDATSFKRLSTAFCEFSTTTGCVRVFGCFVKAQHSQSKHRKADAVVETPHQEPNGNWQTASTRRGRLRENLLEIFLIEMSFGKSPRHGPIQSHSLLGLMW